MKTETWYDPEHDKSLIEQSIAKQYHILPSEQEELSYSDWVTLLSGIMEDTPLGRTVLIRKEDDGERIKRFSPYERRIYNEWRNFRAEKKRQNAQEVMKAISNFEEMFKNMFS